MAGAQVIDPDYQLNPACNWWFMIVSTVVMTGVGWFVADVIVEKRLASKSPEEGGPTPVDASDLAQQKLSPEDWRALKISHRGVCCGADGGFGTDQYSRLTSVHLPDGVACQPGADDSRRGGGVG